MACGAFYVRVRLGGFRACCVFCLSFSSLVLLSCFRPALLLGFLPCLLSCSLSCFLGFVAWLFVLVGLLFPFPFRTASDTKKKGRKVFLRPLIVCCGFVYKSLHITVICCGSSLQFRFPLQVIPATSLGCFAGSFTICPLLSIVEYVQ